MLKLLGNISELRIVSSRCDSVPTTISISLVNKKASKCVRLLAMLQKLTIDTLRSLTVAELGLVPAGSQDDSMLVAGTLAAEFDDSCAYSNLLPSEFTLHQSLLLTKMESFLILMYLRSVPWSIRDLLSLRSNRSF